MFLSYPQHYADYSKHFALFLQSKLNYFIKQEVQTVATRMTFVGVQLKTNPYFHVQAFLGFQFGHSFL